MGEILQFIDKPDKIEYDSILSSDPYLRTTALNALNALGYSATKAGVKQFHKDYGKDDSAGKLSLSDFDVLILSFDPNTRQEIVNRIEIKKKEYLASKGKSTNYIPIIISLLLLLFIEIYGIVSLLMDIWHYITG